MKINKIFAVPHFHFDVEWWKIDKLYSQDVEEILKKALKMLEKYPQFKYTIDQVLAFKPFWDKYPKIRKKIITFIKQGRIEFVGGHYCAPDENIPTGEALIRQFIIGKKWIIENLLIKPSFKHFDKNKNFSEKLSTVPLVGWEIDEFGHPAQIPQILSKCNLKYFAFSRGIQNWEGMHPLVFYWESPDGSKILTHWFAASYGGLAFTIFPSLPTIKRIFTPYSNLINHINPFKPPSENGEYKKDLNHFLFKRELKARIKYESNKTSANILMIPFGTDFTIPLESWVSFVEEWNKKEKTKIAFSTPIEYFSALLRCHCKIDKDNGSNLLQTQKSDIPQNSFANSQNDSVNKITEFPTVSGEFNPILTGCYESREKVKKLCRFSQHKILQTEKLCFMALSVSKKNNFNASTTYEFNYPTKELNFAWELILKNDFHDIICGTGTDKVYKNTLKRYKEAIQIIEKCLNDAGKFICNNINSTVKDLRNKPVSSDHQPPAPHTPLAIVFNTANWEREELVEVPRSPFFKKRKKDSYIQLFAKVPPMGCTVIPLQTTLEKGKYNTDLKISPDSLENKFYSLLIDEETGWLKSIYDKENNIELLEISSSFHLFNKVAPKGRIFGNQILVEEDVGNLWTVQKTGKIFGGYKLEDIEIEEDGNLRSILKIKGKQREFSAVQRIILHSNNRRIDFETEIEFKSRDKRVRVLFPLSIKGKYYFETPFYVQERSEGHWPAQNWVDLCNTNYGCALINSGNPGYEVKGNILSLVLLRSISVFPKSLPYFIIKNLPDILKALKKGIKYQLQGINILEWAIYKYHGLILREWASKGGPNLKGGWTIVDHLFPFLKFWEESDAWERGKHTFKYALYPHKGNFATAELSKIGYEFNNPLIPFIIPNQINSNPYAGGNNNIKTEKLKNEEKKNNTQIDINSKPLSKIYPQLPYEMSFIELSGDNIILSALKKSEYFDAIVLHLYEYKGKNSKFKISFLYKPRCIEKITFTEDKIYKVCKINEDGSFEDTINKWEISAYRVYF